MSSFEARLLVLAVIGLVFGACGILWARTGGSRRGINVGRGLFIGAFLFLGANSSLAAWHRADGLAPLGLSAGFLLILMLWEAPTAGHRDSEVFPYPKNGKDVSSVSGHGIEIERSPLLGTPFLDGQSSHGGVVRAQR